ncbi:MAG: TSUP family transporter [Opitutae bacterium]|nr:TSUP family transporter [Opitutae bacterium]
MPAELTFAQYALLVVAGLVAGTVDAIAGGGGLITLPTLLGVGLPPPLAIGTNKLGSVFGTASATWSFARQGAVDVRECGRGALFTALGAVAGAAAVRLLDPALLGRAIPWLLVAIVVYMIFRPQLGETDRHHRMEVPAFYAVFGLALGFYDGFFGPGVGSFWTIAFVMLLGHNFVRAAAHTKVMNLTSNAASLVFFVFAGAVVPGPGLALAAGQIVGGRLGAHLALTRGARFVRPIFFVMAVLTVAKLIYQHYVK